MDNNAKKIELLQKKTSFVGIDIAKRTHYASLINQQGLPIKVGLKISNNRDGLNFLQGKLGHIDKSTMLIGMEPTGQYWKCIAYDLQKNGYDIVLTNPFHVNRSKEIRDNKNTKNDTKDSLLIAHLIREGKFLNTLLLDGIYADLREYTKLREQLKKELSRVKIQLKTLLDEFLPEYENCFSVVIIKTSLALLKAYGLRGLGTGNDFTDKIDLIIKISKRKIKSEKAETIVKLLASTIGIQEGINGAESSLKSLIRRIEFYQSEIYEVEEKMKENLEKTEEAKYMLTVPGIGHVTAAMFLGQTGSLKKFKNPKQLEKLAGMDLTENSSGQFRGKKHLSKRGRDLLRHTLYLMAIAAIAHDNEFKKLYEYKVKVCKKAKMMVVVEIMLKILNVIFAVTKHKIDYKGESIFERLPKTQQQEIDFLHRSQ